jgi:putative oxidoreductase
MMREFLFGTVKMQSVVGDIGLLVLRVFAGLSLMYAHGLGKFPPPERFVQSTAEMGFPIPVLFAWAAALSEVVGGVLLALGLLTRPSAFFIMCTVGTAAFVRHAPDPYRVKELPLLFLATAFLFLCVGAGRFALDRFVKK